jgi:hypothetical protein
VHRKLNTLDETRKPMVMHNHIIADTTSLSVHDADAYHDVVVVDIAKLPVEQWAAILTTDTYRAAMTLISD